MVGNAALAEKVGIVGKLDLRPPKVVRSDVDRVSEDCLANF